MESLTSSKSDFLKDSGEKFAKTCFLAAELNRFLKDLSSSIERIASANESEVGWHNKPVDPFTTVSKGPPDAQAITGHEAAIASIGPIPKCSRSGV